MAGEPAERARTAALLGRGQREALEAELLRAGAARSSSSQPPEGASCGDAPASASTASGAGTGPTSDVSGRPSGPWEVYFDNEDFALSKRGWWLREFDGTWLLKLPVLVPTASGITTTGYEEITNAPDILERAGLVAHAEVLRKGTPRSVQSLLLQAKVVPFARIHTTREAYSLDLGSAAAHELPGVGALRASGASLLEVTIDTALFDIKHAENEAVAELLFEQGSAAGERLSAAVAQLRLLGGPCAEGAGAAAASGDAELRAFLRARGVDRPANVRGICPKLAAYLETWRPLHMRALLCAGAVADPAKELAAEQEAEITIL